MKLWNRNPDILQFAPLIQKVPPRQCHATFVVKATFKLVQDGVAAPIQNEPVDPFLGPGKPEDMPHFPQGDVAEGPPARLGETPSDVLRQASDLAPFKPKAEILVAGTARAPGGRPVEQMRVVIRVGELGKALVVIGDHGLLDGRPSAVTPFTDMPLGWDKAYGGPGFAPNPAGKGAVEYLLDDGRRWRPLPNLVDPLWANVDPTRPAENRPAGFGPYGPLWPQRAGARMGTFDEAWLEERWPWFPRDFDWSHFNAAPEDQRLATALRGDEALVFENLHPEHPILRSRLPGLRARCFFKEMVTIPGADDHPPAPPPKAAPAAASPPKPAASPPMASHVVDFGVLTLEVPEPPDVAAEIEAARLKARAARAAAKAAKTHAVKPKPEPSFRWREAPLVLDTLFVDLDAGTLNLVWRGTVKLRSLRMREVGDVLLLAEPLAEPEHQKYHYLSILEGHKAAYEARFAPPADTLSPDALESHIEDQIAEGEAELAAVESILTREKERHGALAAEAKAKAAKLMGDAPARPPSAASLAALDDPTLAPLVAEMAATIAKDDPAKAKSFAQEVRMAIDGVPIDKRPDVAALLAQVKDLDRQREATERQVHAALEPVVGKVKGPRFADRDAFLRAIGEGHDLRAADLSGLDLSHLELSRLDLTNANFTGAKLDGARLHGARLGGARFAKATLRKTDFSTARLDGARFSGAKTKAPRFAGASISHADFAGLDLDHADFSHATGEMALFTDARLSHARFGRAHLIKAMFSGAILEGADFREATLADADFFAVKAKGIVMAGARLAGFRACDKANFHHGVFTGLRAEHANWEQAVLTNADFQDAVLNGALMNEVKARHANFDRARLRDVNFEEADLSRARLTRADLARASFERADLTEADLSGANAYGALFIHARLENTVVRDTFLRQTRLERHVRS